MPVYAVAKGRKVGVYDTYPECLKQVHQFTGAKFKKFETRDAAEAYIAKHSSSLPDSPVQTQLLQIENAKPSPSFAIEKVSPSNATLNSLSQRLYKLEETLNKFMTNTTEMLNDIKQTIRSNDTKRSFDTIKEGEEELPPLKIVKREINHEFIQSEDGYIDVYTDGACSNNGKTGAKAGIGVWFGENHPLNVSAPVKGPATNNNAEIQAARVAIVKAAEAHQKRLKVYTDSKFLISCITSWIHKWKKNNWKLSTGGDVKNRDELVKLDMAIQEVDEVKWEYVPGHRGNIGNEEADKLARAGAQEYETNVTFSRKII